MVFSGELNNLIQGKNQVITSGSGIVQSLERLNISSTGITLHNLPESNAFELGLVGMLDTGKALIVHADKAQDACRKFPFWIKSFLLGHISHT